MDLKCYPVPDFLQACIKASVLWTCGSALLLKKVRHEDPQRAWPDFALDTLKQLAGAYWVYLFSAQAAGCAEHLAGAVAGATVGVLIQYILLTVFSRMFENGAVNPRIFRIGEYYTPGGLFVPGAFLIQLLLWVACITATMCVMPLVMPPFVAACGIILTVFGWFPRLEILLVTLVAPCGFYAFQVWITDDFLKKEGAPGVCWQFARKHLPRSLVDFLQETLVNVDPLPLLKPAQVDLAPAPGPFVPPQELLRQLSGASVKSKVSSLARKLSGALSRRSSKERSDAHFESEAKSDAKSATYAPPVPVPGTDVPPVDVPIVEAAPKEDRGQGVMRLLEEEPVAEHEAAGKTATSLAGPEEEANPQPVLAKEGASQEALDLALRAKAAQEAVAEAASHLEAADSTQTNPHRLKELLRQREEELKELHRQLEKVMATEDAAHKQFSEALNYAEVLVAEGSPRRPIGEETTQCAEAPAASA